MGVSGLYSAAPDQAVKAFHLLGVWQKEVPNGHYDRVKTSAASPQPCCLFEIPRAEQQQFPASDFSLVGRRSQNQLGNTSVVLHIKHSPSHRTVHTVHTAPHAMSPDGCHRTET
jgi:hypothetical protein